MTKKLFASIVYVAFIGIAAHFVGEALPRRFFSEKRFPFKVYSFEMGGRIYEYIGIKQWKTKLPDMSKICTDMMPKRVKLKITSDEADKLIKETCIAEFMHIILCILSVGVYFIWKNKTGFWLTLVCIFANIPFILIQRYNRPNLVRLRDKLELKERRRSLCGC